MKIGDLFFGLGIEKDASFQTDVVKAAQKAGDEGGKTLGQRLSASFKTAAKGLIPGLGLGAGIAAFNGLENAVSGAVSFLKDAADAAIKDEESISNLTVSLKANVPGWDGNTRAIEANILAKQELGFRDEELRASLASLVAATHDVTKAEEIQNVAMDLARFKHIDLASASDALIKVEAGRFRILASLGIQLKKGATQEEALAAVRKLAAGQAVEFGKTTAGAAEAAAIAFEELKEDVGKLLLPVLKDFFLFVRKDLIPALRDLGDVVGWVVARVVDVKNTPGQVADWWRALFGIDPGTNRQLEEIGRQGIRNFFAGVTHETETESARWAGNTQSFITDTADALSAGAGPIADAADTLFAGVELAMSDARHKAIEEARGIPGDVATALVQGQQDVESGMKTLTDLMNDKWTDASRIAYYKGVLTSSELARGLKSKDADVRSEAEYVKAHALEQLRLLQTGAADIAAQTGVNLEEGLRLALLPVGEAAQGLRLRVAKELALPDEARTAGETLGGAFAAGIIAALIAKTPAVHVSAGKLLAGLSDVPVTPARPAGTGYQGLPHGVPSFQTGTLSVPKTAMYGLHAQEMVIPPGPAEALRSWLGSSVGSVAGAVTYVYQLSVSGVQQVFRTRDDFIKALDAVSRFGGGDGRLSGG